MAIAPPVVFVHDDPQLAALLDQLCEALRARGVEVRRGALSAGALQELETLQASPAPRAPDGPRNIYAREQHGGAAVLQPFADVDVAVFSSRSRCPAAFIAAAPRLRAIVAPSIGVETIDVAAASARGVLVGHGATPENVVSMAEANVMLLLMLLYRPDLSMQVMAGQRPRPAASGAARWSRTLQRRTVGLIGWGRIGQAVAARLQPFEVELIVARHPGVTIDPALRNVSVRDLDELLAESDIVTLHAAARAGAPPLLGAREIARMKRGAYLINTARGTLVDETALCEALARGDLAGAALDTFAIEPLAPDSALRRLDNVILTPHLVGHTREMFESFLPVALENIVRVLDGKPPRYCKNPQAIPRWLERFEAARQQQQS